MESKPYEFVIIEMLDQILNELKKLNKSNEKIRVADFGLEEQSVDEENNANVTDKFKILHGTTETAEKVKQLEKEVEKLKKEKQQEKDNRDIMKAAGYIETSYGKFEKPEEKAEELFKLINEKLRKNGGLTY